MACMYPPPQVPYTEDSREFNLYLAIWVLVRALDIAENILDEFGKEGLGFRVWFGEGGGEAG